MGRWCSGNTTVFGTVVGGSIPSRPEVRIGWKADFFYNSTESWSEGIVQSKPIFSRASWRTDWASPSPCTINVFFGNVVNHFARLNSWSASACPEKLSILAISRLTGSCCPMNCTTLSHCKIRLPSVHSAWYPTKSKVFFGSPNPCFRWWVILHAVHMPLPAMMTHGLS